MKHIKITDEDITMGDRGCKSSCPIALALKREYNTDNVLNWEIKCFREPEDEAKFIGVFLYRFIG